VVLSADGRRQRHPRRRSGWPQAIGDQPCVRGLREQVGDRYGQGRPAHARPTPLRAGVHRAGDARSCGKLQSASWPKRTGVRIPRPPRGPFRSAAPDFATGSSPRCMARLTGRGRPAYRVEWTGCARQMLLKLARAKVDWQVAPDAAALPTVHHGQPVGAMTMRCFGAAANPLRERWRAQGRRRWPQVVVRRRRQPGTSTGHNADEGRRGWRARFASWDAAFFRDHFAQCRTVGHAADPLQADGLGADALRRYGGSGSVPFPIPDPLRTRCMWEHQPRQRIPRSAGLARAPPTAVEETSFAS